MQSNKMKTYKLDNLRWRIEPIETTSEGRYHIKELGLSFIPDKKGNWIKYSELVKFLKRYKTIYIETKQKIKQK